MNLFRQVSRFCSTKRANINFKACRRRHQHRVTATTVPLMLLVSGWPEVEDRTVVMCEFSVLLSISFFSFTPFRQLSTVVLLHELSVCFLLRFLATFRDKAEESVCGWEWELRERTEENRYSEWAGIKRASVQLSATRHPYSTGYPTRRIPYARPGICRSGQTPDFPERSISSQPAPYNGRCLRCHDIYVFLLFAYHKINTRILVWKSVYFILMIVRYYYLFISILHQILFHDRVNGNFRRSITFSFSF